MKKALIIALMIISTSVAANEQNLNPAAPGGDIKILDHDTCWGVIKALGMPSAPNKWAFGHSWYKNSKGQYVRASCVHAGNKLDRKGYRSFVEVVSANTINTEVSRKEKAQQDYMKDRVSRAKASGVL